MFNERTICNKRYGGHTMAMNTFPQTWDDLENSLHPQPRGNKNTCDKHCSSDKREHSPGCALHQLIDNEGYTIKQSIAWIEEAIEIEAVKSDYVDPFNMDTRKYDPKYASEEQTKRYKHLMTLLKTAVYDYCDCGARHDQGGHYHWCTTQKEPKKKKIKLDLGDIPF
jgi:hypothetical protein